MAQGEGAFFRNYPNINLGKRARVGIPRDERALSANYQEQRNLFPQHVWPVGKATYCLNKEVYEAKYVRDMSARCKN